MAGLTLREKVLYHQVHPLKLAADISASVVSTYLFWVHSLVPGIIVMFAPPILMSAVLLNTLDFTWIRDSVIGRYLKRSMTRAMEAVRFAGTLPMVFGAWFHLPWLIALGLAMVLFGWLRGRLLPTKV